MLAKPSWLARAAGAGAAVRILLVVIPAMVAAVALVFYLFSGRYVSTDNAYVGAQKVLITPEVSGKVVRIAVVEGQLLKPGDELLAIDAVPYRFAAQEAEAKLARVRSDFATSRAISPASASRPTWHARALRPPRPTSIARPRCSATASARRPTSTSRGWRWSPPRRSSSS